MQGKIQRTAAEWDNLLKSMDNDDDDEDLNPSADHQQRDHRGVNACREVTAAFNSTSSAMNREDIEAAMAISPAVASSTVATTSSGKGVVAPRSE